MDPMILVYLTVMTVFLSIPISCYILRHHKRRRMLTKLECNWFDAKMARMMWRINCDDELFDFENPEYQELWELEIGAEDLFLLATKKPYFPVSWDEYRKERDFLRKNGS